jgi:hypothetical protein
VEDLQHPSGGTITPLESHPKLLNDFDESLSGKNLKDPKRRMALPVGEYPEFHPSCKAWKVSMEALFL